MSDCVRPTAVTGRPGELRPLRAQPFDNMALVTHTRFAEPDKQIKKIFRNYILKRSMYIYI
jgi:hypothetical protein